MNNQDQSQKEAIRTLAKMSASYSNRNGTQWVDPIVEAEERDRISKSVDPNYIETGPGPEHRSAKFTEKLFTLLKLGIIIPFVGYGLYGIIKAFLSA